MATRPRLNDLSPQRRQAIVAAMLTWMTNNTISYYARFRSGVPGNMVFAAADRWPQAIDAYLQQAAGSVLPTWCPEDPIPPEFMVVRARDDGTPRAPLVNANPNIPLPASLAQPQVGRNAFAPPPGTAGIDWVGTRLLDFDYTFSSVVGGVLTTPPQESAAPIYWCWQAWLSEYHDEYLVSERGSPPVNYAASFQSLQLLRNQDGRLQLLLSDTGAGFFDTTHTTVQLAPDRWSAWTKIHGNMSYPVGTVRNDGRMVALGMCSPSRSVFAAATPMAVQAGASSATWGKEAWAGPQTDGKLVAVGVAQSDAGKPTARISLFAIGADGRLYNRWENPAGDGTFGEWGGVGGAGISKRSISVLHQPLENTVLVLHIGSDGRVWALTQYPNGYCRDPYQIQPLDRVDGVWGVVNKESMVTCFVLAGTTVAASWQNAPDYHWDTFAFIMGDVATACSALNTDGRLEVFAVDVRGQAWHSWEVLPGARVWSAPQPLAALGAYRRLTAAPGMDGRMVVMGIREDAKTDWYLDRAVQARPSDPTSYGGFVQMY